MWVNSHIWYGLPFRMNEKRDARESENQKNMMRLEHFFSDAFHAGGSVFLEEQGPDQNRAWIRKWFFLKIFLKELI